LDGVAHELERGAAEQDLAGLRGLLETGGDVDGVAGREALLGPGHDLAGRDADPALDAHLRERLAHLDRGPAGAQRAVLSRAGDGGSLARRGRLRWRRGARDRARLLAPLPAGAVDRLSGPC